MTAVDRWLQSYRMSVAKRWIPDGVRLLDIGCHQGELFARLGPRVRWGVGIDPLAEPRASDDIRILQGVFPSDALGGEFDVITILAVFEHLRNHARVAESCRSLLAPGGRVIVTVPSRAVEHILPLLASLRLIHGMSLEEHGDFRPEETMSMFEGVGLRCLCARRFQCGFNNLYVFQRGGLSVEPASAVTEKQCAVGALAPV